MSVVSEKPVRFHFLDGLRAVAASMVVILHAFASNIIKASDKSHLHALGAIFNYLDGYGVDLFFVLSGVVLLRPYLRKQRDFKILEYFKRRFWRIYPPYFVALLFAGLVIWFMSRFPTWYNVKGMHMPFTWRETIHELPIINFDGNYYNLAWWSLGTEILFYICVPIVVFLYPSRKKLTDARLIVTIIAGVVLTVLLQIFVSGWIPDLYSFTYLVLNIGRFVEYPVCFMMGVLIAAKDFDLKHAYWFFGTGVFLVFCSSVYPSVVAHLPLTNPLRSWCTAQLYPPFFLHSGYGLIFGGVITFAFNNRPFRKLLSKPFMLWLGERSYSLFVVHFSVFYLTDNLVARFTTNRDTIYAILTRGIGLPFAVFVAMLLFHFVERKFARGLVTANMFWPWQIKSLRNIGE